MKIINFIVIVVIAMHLISCNKEDSTNSHKVLIKGKISGSSVKRTAMKAAVSNLTLADAQKILLFNSSGGYELFDISYSTFAARAMQGTATALAFLDANNSFIGCLHVGGLNVLPLVSLKDGDNTVIDLSTLTLDGTNVIPSNNPIGNEINLTSEELERYKQFSSFYESLSQNIDADLNGRPGILEQKALYVSTMFDIYCGKWGLNDTPADLIDTSKFFVNYAMRIYGGKFLKPSNSAISLIGPESSPYSGISQDHYAPTPDGFIAFFRRDAPAPQGYPFGSIFLPFDNGKYSLILDNQSYPHLLFKSRRKIFLFTGSSYCSYQRK